MTSKIKVDNINKVSDDSNIIKKCGTTTTIGSGASNPIVVDGSAVTLGRCGGTVALASGATQTGFGRTGTVDWQTGSIKTSTFTAANGEGYFADTSSSAFTMNLPAGSAGAIVSVADYTRTFQTNNLTISPNGSEKIGGIAADAVLEIKGQSATFVYVDATEGWINVQETQTSQTGNPPFIIATGGTVTTCGNFKIHTFTGPGSFVVCNVSSTAVNNTVGYQVVAGGGGGTFSPSMRAGGGGAGGFREGRNAPVDNFTASPLVANAPTNAVTVTATTFPIDVGGGGAGAPSPANGANSVFSTITSAGGGKGGCGQKPSNPEMVGGNGGSGGGGGAGCGNGNFSTAGTGNTPSVSPSQGNNGGGAAHTYGQWAGGGGGGGASAVGGTATSYPSPGPSSSAGVGGAGVTSSITGSPVAKAGGGGGGGVGCTQPTIAGGTGGGGAGQSGGGGSGLAGTANTGGGGGGGGFAGGSGVVIIRYKFQ
jgi:hypothetical protein